MRGPKISIIVPTYNRGGQIRKTVDSLLRQRYPNRDIIIVDDASTDDTRKVLQAYGNRIKVIRRSKNGGPAAARNDGIKIAKGEYVAFIDSDCTASREWISELVDFIVKQPDGVAGVCGIILPPRDANFLMRALYFLPELDGNTSRVLKAGEPISVENISCNNALWKMNVLKKMHGFDEQFFRYKAVPEDSELCYRVLRDGYRFVMTPGAATYHHFRATIRDFLKQSYRAGIGGGLLMRIYPDWFGTKKWLVYGFPAFLALAVFKPSLLLLPFVFSAPAALRALSRSGSLKYFFAVLSLQYIKYYFNIAGMWAGMLRYRR